MGALARSAGLSQSGLLHYFATKELLLEAVLDLRDQRDGDRLDAVTPAEAIGFDVLDEIPALVAANLHQAPAVRLYAMLAGEATDPAHPAHAWLARHLLQVVNRFDLALQRGQDAGTVRADAPTAAVARAVVAFWDGLQVQALAWTGAAEGRPEPDWAAEMTLFLDTLRMRWESSPDE